MCAVAISVNIDRLNERNAVLDSLQQEGALASAYAAVVSRQLTASKGESALLTNSIVQDMAQTTQGLNDLIANSIAFFNGAATSFTNADNNAASQFQG
jgi:hypothetical protein